MKNTRKKLLVIFAICAIATISFFAFLFVQSGKNKEEYIACFETSPLAYRSFRHISKWPKLMAATTFFIKYPSGLWKLPVNCSYGDLLHCLRTNKRIDTECKITFIDGMTFDDIEKTINENQNFSAQRVQIEEGTIFPETYCFKVGCKRSTIIKIAQELMNAKIEKLWTDLEMHAKKCDIQLPLNKKEFLILASIIQKEGVTREDMSQIAGCFLTRLQQHIRLHSCATVLYGMKKAGYKIYKRDDIPIVLLKDTKIKTPYNTYLLDRLPIGPICIPGNDALEALAQTLHDGMDNAVVTASEKKLEGKLSKKLQYKAPLYFYACNGKIIYAKTLEAHNRNKYRCNIELLKQAKTKKSGKKIEGK